MRTLNRVIVSLLLCCASVYTIAQPAAEAQQLKEALNLFQQQKYKEAAALFGDLHQRSPKQAGYLNNLAAAQMAQGEVELALQTLQRAIETSDSYTITQKNINELYAYKASQAYARALDKEEAGQTPQLILVTAIDAADSETPTSAAPPEVVPAAVNEVAEAQTINSEPVIQQQLTELTANWAAAWMQGDVESYLQLYSATFNPDGNTSHDEWVSQRRFRLRNSKQVQVSYNQLSVYVAASQQAAIVEFVQFYQSGSYQDKVRKQLLWINDNNQWRISKETVIENL